MLFWRKDSSAAGAWITFSAICVAIVLALGVALPAVAGADTAAIIAPSDPHAPTVESGWQAGTCNAEPPEVGTECSVATPGQFFETAAAHPKWGFTQFIVRHTTLGPLETPIGELKDVRVDLPVGLSVNPGAAKICAQVEFDAEACPATSKVGESRVTVSIAGLVVQPMEGVTAVPVYDVQPVQGKAARFGFKLAGNDVYLEGDIAYAGDYHEGFSIAVPAAIPIEGLGTGAVLKNRLVFNGRAGDGTFLTTPSTCLGEAFTQSGSVYSTFLLAASIAEENSPGYAFPQSAEPPLESPIPPAPRRKAATRSLTRRPSGWRREPKKPTPRPPPR